MIIWWPLTDGGQDGQREEGGLGVVPVDAELLAHDVHTRPGRLGDDLLVGVQGRGHKLKSDNDQWSESQRCSWPDLMILCVLETRVIDNSVQEDDSICQQ